MKRPLVLYPTTVAVITFATVSAFAAWSQSAVGAAAAKGKSVPSMLAITPVTAVSTPGQATVTWTAPTVTSTTTSITGYRVVRWDAATNGTGSNVCAANLTSTAVTCSDSPAVAPASYWYTVAAVFTKSGGSAPTWTGVTTARVQANVTAPVTVSTPALRTTDDSGASSSDGITTVTTPHFTGTATAGATVKILDGVTPVGSGTATGGNYNIQVSALNGNNGSDTTGVVHTITATATVGAATVSSPGSIPVTVDSTAPTVSSVASSNCTPVGAACVAGRGDNGDKVSVTFSEKIVEALTGSQTMTVCAKNDCSPHLNGGNSKITIPGLTSGITVATNYVGDNATGTAAGALSVSADQLTITYTLTTNLSSATTGTAQTFSLVPDSTNVADVAGNAATATFSGPSTRFL